MGPDQTEHRRVEHDSDDDEAMTKKLRARTQPPSSHPPPVHPTHPTPHVPLLFLSPYLSFSPVPHAPHLPPHPTHGRAYLSYFILFYFILFYIYILSHIISFYPSRSSAYIYIHYIRYTPSSYTYRTYCTHHHPRATAPAPHLTPPPVRLTGIHLSTPALAACGH